MMPRVLPVLLLALMLLPLAPAATETSPPEPSLGDRWDYATPEPPDSNRNRTVHERVDGFEDVTLNGTAYPAVRIVTNATSRASGKLTSYTNTTTTTWARVSDRATLKTSIDTSIEYQPSVAGYHIVTNTTYREPCAKYLYPLDVGRSWNVTCAGTSVTSTLPPLPATTGTPSNTTTRTAYVVVREERVTVPAGAFDTLVVNATVNNQTETRWYAPAACNAVKVQSPQVAGVDELLSFECAKPPTPPASATPASPIPGAGALAVAAAALVAAALARRRS